MTATIKVDQTEATVEWPTLALYLCTLAIWALGCTVVYRMSPVLGIVVTGVAIAQFSSFQHEALHGHPFRSGFWNEVLATPALCLTVPYGRFRDSHLAHHHDPALTDPYDDPESNYLDPAVWAGLPRVAQGFLRLNNTLLGRITLGPLIGNAVWLRTEVRLLRTGDGAVWRDWALHVLGLIPILAWIWWADIPALGYLGAAWIGHGLLKIRTFLEHRAHVTARARTVIIEDRGPLALLFLNNNFHAVHHMHPKVAWYRLPVLYAANRDHYLRRNEGYAYASYAAVFARYFLRSKDPVAHPFFPMGKDRPD